MTCFLVDCSPSITNSFKTLIEIWSGKSNDYSMLNVFGCPIYYHVDHSKFEHRSRNEVLLAMRVGVKKASDYGYYLRVDDYQ